MPYYVSFCANGMLETFLLANNTPILNHGLIHLQNKIFPSIFIFEEDRILVKASMTDYSIRDCGADFLEDMPLYDGMFIEANCQQEGLSYQILVQDASLLTMNHRYYYMEDEILVGSGDHCQIHSMLVNTLAHEQGRLQRQGNRAVISSLNTRTGVYVNGVLCGDSKRLVPGDMIWCMGLSIVFMGDYIGVSCQGIITLQEFNPHVAEFPPLLQTPEQLERPPRVSIPLESGVVEISAPTPKEKDQLPVAVTAGPAFVLSLGMLVSVGFAAGNMLTMGELSGLIASVSAAFTCLIGALLWPSYISSQHKKNLNKQEEKRLEKYSLYAEGKTRELEDKYNRNRKVWNEVLAPEPDKLAKMVEKYQSDHSLWERGPEDDDFLEVRLGLGSHDFEVQVKVMEESFNMEEDELRQYPKSIAGKYKTLKDVPEVLSIAKEKQVGVFGQKDKVYELLEAIMIEIMALHSPDNVKIVCFFSEDEKEHYLWAKDLPALWSNDQTVRFMATTPEQAHCILQYLEHRVAEFPDQESYVILVSNQALLEQKLMTRGFNREMKQVYSVYFEEYLSNLPKGCRATVRCNTNYGGLYCRRNDQNWFVKFSQDSADENTRINFQKAMLAVPFSLSQTHEEIVEKLSFLDMFHCGSVEELQVGKRWLNHRSHRSLSAPLGLTTGEALFSLDIHEEYHGCHGLVVGDSDRDKTTLLQSLILSMMVCHSPQDFSVLLMEFAGSNFVAPFQNAPHVLGTVSTLPQCRGMMIPLRLEIQRRKRLFRNIAKEYELDSLDINGYQKFYLEGKVTEVMTRIAVVVDEFLPLLRDDPKLLEELLYLVKVGQLLGIHLILATATPSIVKDAHFASQFRVCLNLAHPDDMEEMVGMPPLHSLRHAGRCIVQVGQNEVCAEVQTGNCLYTYVKQEHFLPQHAQSIDVINYAGQRIHRLPIKNNQEITNKTQLEAVLDYMSDVAEYHHCAVEKFLYHEIERPLEPAVEEETEASSTEFVQEEVYEEEYYAPQEEEEYDTPQEAAQEDEEYYAPQEVDQEEEEYDTPQEVAQEEDEYYAPEEVAEEEDEYDAPEEVAEEEEEYYVPQEVAEEEEEYYAPEEVAEDEYYAPEEVAEEDEYYAPQEVAEDEYYAPQEVAEEEEEYYAPQEVAEEEDEYYAPEEVAQEEDEYYAPQEVAQEEEEYYAPQEVAEEEYDAPQEVAEEEYYAPQEVAEEEYDTPQEVAEEDDEYYAPEEAVEEDDTQVYHPKISPSPEEPVEEATEEAVDEPVAEEPADFSGQFQAKQEYAEFEEEMDFPTEEPKEERAYPSVMLREEEAAAAYPSTTPQCPVSNVKALENARAAFVSRANKVQELAQADLTTIQFDHGMFVGGTQVEVIENMMLTLAKFSKIDYIFSDNLGKCGNISDHVVWGEEKLDRAIEEIREHVWSMKPEKCIILIPSLHKFCEVVTRRSLDRLTRLLKKHFTQVAMITGDTPENVARLRDLDFLNVAVKQEQGIITNPKALETLIPYLAQGLVPPSVQVKETDFLYYNDKTWKILYM